jgi:hypothetical protein
MERPGFKATHVAAEFNFGGVTAHLGHSVKKMSNASDKTKTTHYGISGGVGDTGLSYLVQARSVKEAGKSDKTNPWLVNVSKSLGGGATVIFEHANKDSFDSGKAASRIGLHVSF